MDENKFFDRLGKNYIFGRFEDDKKEKTLSFRVSKETHDLFETHAKSQYGDVSNALKEIFLDYMSSFAFRRQSFNKIIRIFVPLFADEDDVDSPFLPFDDFHIMGFLNPDRIDMLDLNTIKIPNQFVRDYRNYDISNEMREDEYNDLSHWIHKSSHYDLEDGIVIDWVPNNYLDKNIDGIYGEYEKDKTNHLGLLIFEWDGEYYYILVPFHVDDSYNIKLLSPYMVSNEVAFKNAMDCGNLELAKYIDSFNEGTSNIEHDKQLLRDKRENLLHQLDEIDEKLSRYES